jgi:uncharacterized protein (DUF362 family)
VTSSERSVVSILKSDRSDYPLEAPFDPDQRFPEYPFHYPAPHGSNWVYAYVRSMLADLGLDRDHFGTPDWNPLSPILKPGQRVFIKPNLVISEHELGLEGVRASVAHGSVIRPIIDYAHIAVGPAGRIFVGDSPIKEVDFAEVTRINGLRAIVDFYTAQGVHIELLDIRDLQAFRDERGVIVGYDRLPGDPLGYRVVDLGRNSMLAELSPQTRGRLRSTAAIYENEATRHHTGERNEYSMPRSILEADAIVSIAKLKVHRKAGLTASLKNMVGATNEKRWLPHHRAGTPSEGGDMVPDGASTDRKIHEALDDLASRSRYGKFLRLRVYPVLRSVYVHFVRPWLDLRKRGDSTQDFREGDWHGNDTIWRTTLDLNMVIRYADKHGQLQPLPQRNYLSIIDGIIGGEREGPLHPSPKPAGLLIGGVDPVAVDLVCSALMGFDASLIPTISRAGDTPIPIGTNRPEEIELRSNRPELRTWDSLRSSHFGFIPAKGWEGHVELPGQSPERAVAAVGSSTSNGRRPRLTTDGSGRGRV